MPADAEAGGGLMVAVVQLAIALGSALGGVLLDAGGHRASFAASAALLLAAAAAAGLTARASMQADRARAERAQAARPPLPMNPAQGASR